MLQKLTPIIISLLVSATSSSAISGISLSQAIDKTEIAFEETANFEIELRWSGSPAAYRFDRPLNPYFDRLKIERFSSSIHSVGEGPDEITVKTYKYSLKPTASGVGKIESIAIDYASWPDSLPGELITEAITITIAQPVVEDESSSFSIWLWILGGFLSVGIIIAVVARSRSRGDKLPVMLPRQILLDGLRELKSEAGNDFKNFQTGLLKLITDFLKNSYDINLAEFSDTEIEDALAATALSVSQREQLKGWIVKANEDKFKPLESSPGETIRLETEVRSFFENI